MKFVSEYEDEFVRQVMERGTAEHLKQTSLLKKTIDTAKRRIEQIDSVISQLYEDKVVGEITAEMFTKLSAKYIAEQEEQSAALKVAQKELVTLEAKKTDTTKFIDLVRKYSQITELTPQILNEFIDKVTVHQAVKVDGKRRQDIEVYFNGVGQISSDAEKKSETTEWTVVSDFGGIIYPSDALAFVGAFLYYITIPILPYKLISVSIDFELSTS